MTTRLRFAPSPTGLLHAGNVRTALVNYLYAKKTGGEFMLRIDDTDRERSKDEYITAIEQDLAWLGINYDRTFKQSERFDRYEEIKQKLIAMGKLYPCYETGEELDTKRKFQMKRGAPPIYDRAALKLTDAEKAAFEAAGRQPHYRFNLTPTDIVWNDLVRGETKFNGANLSDPILFREDGSLIYMLCSVVDDGDYEVTHIVRGEDHVTNTAIQIQIAEALGYKLPTFAHIALLKGKDKEMSKREGGFDIRSLREEGIEAQAILSLLAKMGTSDAIDVKTIDELVAEFDFKKFGRATAIYNPEDLQRLTAKITAHLDYDAVKYKVKVDKNFWDAVKANLKTVAEVEEWNHICSDELTPVVQDKEFLAEAAKHLPAEPWDNNTFSSWMDAVKNATGKKGKDLFMPIRLALTAREHGPELKAILPLIGRGKVLKRLVD